MLEELLKKNVGKQIVSIHGNCQTSIVRWYLLHNKEFISSYILSDLPEIFNITNDQIALKVLRMSDIIISQVISNNNKFSYMLSIENIRTTCSDKIIITIANLYFDVYWPQMFIKNVYNPTDNLRWGKFPNGDMILDDLSRR